MTGDFSHDDVVTHHHGDGCVPPHDDPGGGLVANARDELSHDDLDAIEQPHQPDYDSVGSCVCGESYPCTTLGLVAEVRSLWRLAGDQNTLNERLMAEVQRQDFRVADLVADRESVAAMLAWAEAPVVHDGEVLTRAERIRWVHLRGRDRHVERDEARARVSELEGICSNLTTENLRLEVRVAELTAGIERVKAARADYAISHMSGHFREVGLLDAVLWMFGVNPDLLDGSTDTQPDHEFLPVAGHPDDDECTHRSDGTDETYCGLSRAEHDCRGGCEDCRTPRRTTVGIDRYRMHQSAEVVSILDGEDGAVIQVSRALGNPRARLLALELCERLNHEDDALDNSCPLCGGGPVVDGRCRDDHHHDDTEVVR